MGLSRVFRCWLLLLLGSSGLAQPFPPLDGVVASDSSLLDAADLRAINQRAAALEAEGLEPLVLLIEADVGDSLSEAEAYLDVALEHYGLAEDGELHAEALALFVGTRPLPESEGARPLYIAYNIASLAVLDAPAAGGTVADGIRNEVMAPRLQAGDFGAAFSDGLEAIAERLGAEAAPAAGPEDEPATTATPVEPQARPLLLNPLLWLVLLGGSFFVYLGVVRPRRQVARRRAELERELRALKGELSQALLELDLPDDPEAQTEMALLLGLLSGQAEELAEWQRRYADAVLVRQQFEEGFRQLQREEAQGAALEALLPRYRALQALSAQVSSFAAALNARWNELSQQLSALPERLQALGQALQRLPAGYPEARPDAWPPPEALSSPLGLRLQQADAALGAGEQVRALQLTDALARDVVAVEKDLHGLLELHEALNAAEADLARYREQGFRLPEAWRELSAIRQQLAIALELLAQAEYRVVGAQLEEVAERSQRLADLGKSLVALQRENERRLAELEQQGELLQQRIEQAATVFAAISDFAPANWRDIRGNGSEAQKAAERAQHLWEQAEAANRLDGTQQFEAARDALDAAERELTQAGLLLDSIDARLGYLRQAQQTAREELEQVAREVAAQRAYLQRSEVDRDVSSAPEQKLQQAESLLQRIRSELEAEKPDWLSIMQTVQNADRLSEEATTQTRSEQEAMQQRRRLLESERTEASAALERVARFAEVHARDIGSTAMAALEQAQDRFRAAERLRREAEQQTEAELARTLSEAASAFDHAQRLAEEAFTNAERDFAEMEALRAQAAEASARSLASFEALRDFVNQHRLSQLLGRSVQALAAGLPDYHERLGRDALERVVQQAAEADETVAGLFAQARQQVQALEATLQQEQQLELERRRQAAERARRSSAWGAWPSGGISLPTRSAPRARSSPPASRRSSGGARRSGGSWGGGSRKSGGGW